jgi:hypothetical protein
LLKGLSIFKCFIKYFSLYIVSRIIISLFLGEGNTARNNEIERSGHDNLIEDLGLNKSPFLPAPILNEKGVIH